MKSTGVILVLIILFFSLTEFGADIYLPSFPALAQDFGKSATDIKLTLTLYLLGVGITQIFYGTLSDRYRRKYISLIGLGIFIIGAILNYISETFPLFFTSRIIQGAGLGAAAVIPFSVMRDLFDGVSLARGISALNATGGIASIIAHVLGGYLQENYGWQAGFLFLFIFGLLIFLLLLFFLKETIQAKDLKALQPASIRKNYSSYLTNAPYLLFLISGVCIYSIIVASQSVLPFLYEKGLRLSPEEFGMMTLIGGLSYFIGTLVNMLLVSSLGMNRMIQIGFIIGFLSALLLLIGKFAVLFLLIPTSLIWFSLGLILPNVITKALHFALREVGTASAIIGILFWIGSGVATMIISWISAHNQVPLAIFCLVLLILSLVCYIFAEKRSPKRKSV